jgi:mannose-6-phosphate isomerase-like protein (cupin superfamily)
MDASARIARQELFDAALDGSPAVARVRVSRVELAPGQAAGLHRHPCDVVGYVLTGTIRFHRAGRPETVLAAGDAFHEPALASIARFDNASETETAAFVPCYLLPSGEDRLIEMMEPTG